MKNISECYVLQLSIFIMIGIFSVFVLIYTYSEEKVNIYSGSIHLGKYCLSSKGWQINLDKCDRGNEIQKWFFFDDKIIHRDNEKCIATKKGRSKKGTPIVLYRCNGKKDQRWNFKNGMIIGTGEQCLVQNKSRKQKQIRLELGICNDHSKNKWRIDKL